ncbi:MAG: nucleotidyltransferase domain-containing protein [Dehalococcoidia bacterium]
MGGGLSFWINGGWGVDALVGRQTRCHRDLDLFVELRHLDSLRKSLSRRGFAEIEGGRDANFVMVHEEGSEVDVHVFELDSQGNGLYTMSDGRVWLCPAEGLTGFGVILRTPVRCFTAALQLQCYSGYELDDDDRHDIAVLRKTFPAVSALPEIILESPRAPNPKSKIRNPKWAGGAGG